MLVHDLEEVEQIVMRLFWQEGNETVSRLGLLDCDQQNKKSLFAADINAAINPVKMATIVVTAHALFLTLH